MDQNLSAGTKQQVEEGIDIVRRGGIIAFPTDTVYGLGASIYNETAVRQIFTVKRRPLEMALPVLVASIEQLKDVTVTLPKVALYLAEYFWPGGLTMVLPKSEKVPDIVTAHENSIAVRVPDHPVPVAIIKGLGMPIIGTSANVHGKPSPVSAAEVRKQLGKKVDLIIDGGRSPGTRESTIIDLTGEKPVIIREGTITISELNRACKVI